MWFKHSSFTERTSRSAKALQFGARGGVRTTRTPAVASHGSNPAAPLRIPIAEQNAAFPQEAGFTRDLPQALNHEGFVRVRCRAQHLHTPGL